MERVRRSTLAAAIVESRVIPNGVDLTVFRPASRSAAREALALPQDATILLSVAQHLRASAWKDYGTLASAVALVADAFPGRRVICVALGDDSPPRAKRAGGTSLHSLPERPGHGRALLPGGRPRAPPRPGGDHGPHDHRSPGLRDAGGGDRGGRHTRRDRRRTNRPSGAARRRPGHGARRRRATSATPPDWPVWAPTERRRPGAASTWPPRWTPTSPGTKRSWRSGPRRPAPPRESGRDHRPRESEAVQPAPPRPTREMPSAPGWNSPPRSR